MFNKILKTTRTNAKITQKQMAEKIEMSERNYQRLEAGEIEPNIENLIKIANILNISIDYLVGRTKTKNK